MKKNNQGSVLLITMIFILGFTLFGFAVMKYASMQNEDAEKRISSEQAFWMAEGGIQRASNKLPTLLANATYLDSGNNGTKFDLQSSNTGSNQYTITSLGYSPSTGVYQEKRKIQSKVSPGTGPSFGDKTDIYYDDCPDNNTFNGSFPTICKPGQENFIDKAISNFTPVSGVKTNYNSAYPSDNNPISTSASAVNLAKSSDPLFLSLHPSGRNDDLTSANVEVNMPTRLETLLGVTLPGGQTSKNNVSSITTGGDSGTEYFNENIDSPNQNMTDRSMLNGVTLVEVTKAQDDVFKIRWSGIKKVDVNTTKPVFLIVDARHYVDGKTPIIDFDGGGPSGDQPFPGVIWILGGNVNFTGSLSNANYRERIFGKIFVEGTTPSTAKTVQWQETSPY